ncbi:cysteine-rich receptor-like protein kinase 8, partial [Tanacetum coccineum]
NDHQGLILISKKLTGLENYSTWKRSMMIALNARNKLKLMNGEYEEHVVNSLLRSLWERANDMVISWILNIVSEKIRNNLSFVNSAIALWSELNKHYSQLDGHRIYQVSNDIANLKQGNNTIELYYQKLKVGYPPGHPLHNKYVSPPQRNNSSSRINAVNQVNGSEKVIATPPSYSDTPNTPSAPSDAFVHSRMDQLQEQSIKCFSCFKTIHKNSILVLSLT